MINFMLFQSEPYTTSSLKIEVPSVVLMLIMIGTIVIALTACTKKSETQTSTAEHTQTAAEVQTGSNRLLVNRNVSEFAGTWVTSQGQSMQIRANGMLAEIAGNKYIAYLADDFEADVYIIPKGIEFIHWTGAIQTDTTQDRVFIQYASERVPTNDDVYYREGEASAASQSLPRR